MAAHRMEMHTYTVGYLYIIRNAYENVVTFVPRFSRSFKTDNLFMILCIVSESHEIQDGSSKTYYTYNSIR